jgi:hypothetical protein
MYKQLPVNTLRLGLLRLGDGIEVDASNIKSWSFSIAAPIFSL